MGALAEFLAGAVNANLGGREHATVYVERQVVAWFKEVMGFPEKASGLLVSGTSMATLLALAIARHRTAPTSMRRDGVGAAGDKLVGYASSQAHSSVGKAFEFMGLGATKLRAIATDPQHRIDVAALDAAIEADVRAGLRPFVLVASAGTVNIGAFDDLVALRRIADRHGLWLHVDGAFGALTVLAPSERHRVDGIDAADSIAFDFHKWLHVPYDAGCVLVRDGALHQATFGGRLAYLTSAEVGAASGEPWYCDFGVELSRGFRALKVWFTLKHYGLDRLGAVIARNCAQARQLAALVETAPELELAAAVPLNIVCLRYRGRGGLDADRLERLNRQLITRLHLDGLAIPSATALDGRTVIRVCITNHRTTDADIEAFVGQVLALGRELAAATEPATVRQP
jgi:glutamate/tyrosine decarboxylase-like PLP-dependent enzyme